MPVFDYLPLEESESAEGCVVVVDVLRAFTTAAYAFQRGVLRIFPVLSVEEALARCGSLPGALVMGEVDGEKPEGFDFGNSPTVIADQQLDGKTLIQRTSAGTQGLVRARHADHLFTASFVMAAATAQAIRQLDPERVTFVITGTYQGRDGDEDLACAEYMAALINGDPVEPKDFTQRVMTSSVGEFFLKGDLTFFGPKDMELSLRVNCFDFCCPVTKSDGHLMIHRQNMADLMD
jgi:2-phosphosulfolactate phosphatase